MSQAQPLSWTPAIKLDHPPCAAGVEIVGGVGDGRGRESCKKKEGEEEEERKKKGKGKEEEKGNRLPIFKLQFTYYID
jgi:hypothetical protein